MTLKNKIMYIYLGLVFFIKCFGERAHFLPYLVTLKLIGTSARLRVICKPPYFKTFTKMCMDVVVCTYIHIL